MKYLFCLILFSIHFSGVGQEVFRDQNFDPDIKTAYLFPANDPKGSNIHAAVVPLSQNVPLVLTFDEVNTDEAAYYYASIIHCNADWTKSGLNDMEYLYDFNEFFIEEYAFSINTKIPYTQFKFRLPRVKVPGNYIIKVYPEEQPDNPILTRRFVVYDRKVGVLPKFERSSGISERITNHQINFKINYGSFPILNPHMDVKVVIRQNFRWDTAIEGLKPTFVRTDINELEYRYFDLQNNFFAGNEYRFFDLRSILYSGQNVAQITEHRGMYQATLYTDIPKGKEAYAVFNDYNGGYIIENSDRSGDYLEADYIQVHFNLRMDQPLSEDIYLAGALTGYKFDKSTKMTYDDEAKTYQNSLLLKQGWYDYIYYVPNHEKNPYIIEGSHFETRNNYDIIVYYSHPQLRADIVVGYWKGSN
jgi:hypothetical protein